MPGHSLRLSRGRWRVFHDSNFQAMQTSLQNLHDRFWTLGSKNMPRSFHAGGSGNDLDIKQVLLLEAGTLEALQRWQTTAPAAVYQPGELTDYDQITEFLNPLNIELATHPNADGSVSPPYHAQPLPKSWRANPGLVSPEYDNWLVARVEEFRDELTKKPNVTLVPNPRPSSNAIKYLGALLDQILAMLPLGP
jgi:hypothetical protein